MQRLETDFFVEEVYDVVAWLQVRELTSDGHHPPVPVLSQSPLDHQQAARGWPNLREDAHGEGNHIFWTQ